MSRKSHLFLDANTTRFYLMKVAWLLLGVSFSTVSCIPLTINTSSVHPRISGRGLNITGNITNDSFNGPNKKSWNYSFAVFDAGDELANLLSQNNTQVTITGANGLKLKFNGDVTLRTTLDVSGASVNGTPYEDGMFRLGGFVRRNGSCCTLGAGPGAGYSYHGGGNGGKGGGYYQDRNTTNYYGWNYPSFHELIGGSTGTALFPADLGGTGGGAIEIMASGKITIDKGGTIKANGYTTENTSNSDCAGASAGGIIRLRADEVLVRGTLRATGGNSGFSSNTSNRCGGGGGGGIIQIFTLTNSTMEDYKVNRAVRTKGGSGRGKGENGIDYAGVFFEGTHNLEINTTSCRMTWHGTNKTYNGKLSMRTYASFDYSVCNIAIDASLYISKDVTVKLGGKQSLLLTSNKGNVDVHSDLVVDNREEAKLGGYASGGPGEKFGCGADKSYQHNFEQLVGGSVCGKGNQTFGGGAIEISAPNGKVVIGARIKVDAVSSDNLDQAMGGTIRILGKYVVLNPSARLSARAGGDNNNGSGGVIQISSTYDVEGLCEDNIDVSSQSGEDGLCTIRVSVEKSYQVQYIVEGVLEIDTTNNIWTHLPNLANHSMAYSYYGSRHTSRTSDPTTQLQLSFYVISYFPWQVPIFINRSVVIRVTGEHSLHVHSKEGMYFGADIDVSYPPSVCQNKSVGGFCKCGIDETRGYGPGAAMEGTSGGGGHGGKGGNFEEKPEKPSNKKFGWSYGYNQEEMTAEPDLLGGSTGSAPGFGGCGGGAVKLSSERSITVGGKINVTGFSGGNSGGTIIIEADQVNITSEGLLDASGNAAVGSDSGGGGGGVVYIKSNHAVNSNNNYPSSEVIRVNGGIDGQPPGENGFTIFRGEVIQKYPEAEEEDNATLEGCVKTVSPSKNRSVTLLGHEALPSKCRMRCNDTKFAAIRKEKCFCVYTKSFIEVNETLCNARCLGNYKYRCGGKEPLIYNAYRTGYKEPADNKEENKTSANPSEEIAHIENLLKNVTNETVIKIVTNMSRLTRNLPLNKGDTRVALFVLETVATKPDLAPTTVASSKELGKGCLHIADRLLDTDLNETYGIQKTGGSENEITSPNQVLKSVERIGVNLGSKLSVGDKFVIETEKIGMGVKILDLNNVETQSLPDYSDLNQRWRTGNKITIPKKVLEDKGTQTMTICYVLYDDLNDVLAVNLTAEDFKSKEKWEVNSMVIAVATSGAMPEVLPEPISISLESQVQDKEKQCKFLNFTSSSVGKWSSRGCNTSKGEGNITNCVCNHMTNFAILMQVNDFEISKGHQDALSFITYVGCGISLFALALTLATFLSLETLASERTSIHKNLVVAIGLAQIIFLAGIDAVANHIACTVVALFLHYFYTAAFTWMLAEGIHLYTKVVEVFSEGSKMKFYYAIGWGLPAIIVLVSASARIEGYGTEQSCWISREHGLIWAFVTPVLVVITINFVVMIMVIRVILASVTSLQSDGNTSQVKAGVKGMIVLLPLLGLTWVFGLLAIDEKTIVFQYFFAILNSLQGLFIFAFHCVGNTEVRVAYKRLHEKRTLAKSLPEHTTSSVGHDYRHGFYKDSSKKRRQNSGDNGNSIIDDEIIITKTIRSVSDVKLNDQVQMQTFGDADSGRWSLNCPSPDPVDIGKSSKA